MNRLLSTSIFLSVLLVPVLTVGQHILTLEEALEIAHDKSIRGKINSQQWELGQLDYKIFKKSMFPELSLSSTLPNLNRSLEKITLPDGSDSYVSRSQMLTNLGLSINQPLIWTGGEIYFNSSLERIDLFGQNGSTNWLGNPISFGFSQAIFGYNDFRWSRKRAPILYDASQKQNIENAEDVSIRTVQLYYNWLVAEIQHELAVSFKQHNDTIYQISQGRYRMGRIAENDLLQAELNALNSDIDVKQNELNLTLSKMRLEQFLNDKLLDAKPSIDTELIEIDVPVMKAVELAQENMSDYSLYELRHLNAQSAVAQARSNNSPTVSLFGSFGLTKSAPTAGETFANPQDRELLVLNMNIPIYRFGYNKSQTERAKINQEVTALELQLEQQSLEQQLFEQIGNFTLLQEQVKIAKRADEVAAKGYQVTRQRFMIGKIDILELNQAVTRRTSARMDYMNALRNYWTAYFQIRKITHYDFLNQTEISVP